MRVFLGKFRSCSDLSDEDIGAWILRNDKDVDGGLNFIELVGALQTMAKAPYNAFKELEMMNKEPPIQHTTNSRAADLI